MEVLSDDEFDHVRDFDLSDLESEADCADHDTPSTTPPRTQTPRPSSRKISTCPYDGCDKTFNRNARLQEHLRSHTGERPFKCPEASCSKTFLRETHLKRHSTSAHSDIRNYKCTWNGCDKSFTTGTRLRRHLQSHEGQEKYRCRGYGGCNEVFRKHETLRKHILTAHEHTKPYPCDHVDPATGRKCAQSFQTADKLKGHQRAVHDSTRFSCTICLASHAAQDVISDSDPSSSVLHHFFATFSDLQEHIREVHPPTCQYCPTSFRTNKELTRHLELQHGVIDPNKQDAKQYPCMYPGCKQIFTKQGNLNVHVKTVHERQKDFVCGVTEVPVPAEVGGQSVVFVHGCGRSFTSKASLIEHVRTAHLHLPNRKALKREEKRIKRQIEDGSSDESKPKRRMPRKDKGISKSSVLDNLTGLKVAADSPASMTGFPLSYLTPSENTGENFESFMEDESDDFDQLSGSMTIVGDHLYHQGQGYHLVSENGSAESTYFDDGQYVPCHPANRESTNDQTDLFFPFEHEREAYHPVIDPVLLST